jgi:hypothetical protein
VNDYHIYHYKCCEYVYVICTCLWGMDRSKPAKEAKQFTVTILRGPLSAGEAWFVYLEVYGATVLFVAFRKRFCLVHTVEINSRLFDLAMH